MVLFYMLRGIPAFYKNILHKFLDAIQLARLGPLLNALIDKKEWGLFAVKKKWDSILDPIKKAKKFIAKWKAQAFIFCIFVF